MKNIIRCINSILCVILALFLNSVGYCNEIMEGDAETITLSNIRLLESDASYPYLSMDGKSIIYSKFEVMKKSKTSYRTGYMSLWKINLNGRNREKIINDAYNGTWSPDGDKISFCRPSNIMGSLVSTREIKTRSDRRKWSKNFCIYDLKEKRIYEIINNKNICNFDSTFKWTKDSRKILHEGRKKLLINLDSLQLEDIIGMVIDWHSKKQTEKNYSDWKQENISTNEHPNTKIYVGTSNVTSTIKNTGRLWVENNDGSYKKLLLDANVELRIGSLDITPDAKKIVFEVKDKGVYVADLSISKQRKETIYNVNIGIKDYSRYDGRFNQYLRESPIWVTISEPKMNPLNKKTIGPGKKLKGYAQIIKVSDDYSVIRVRQEMYPINKGDVMHSIRSSSNRMGGLNIDNIWAVLKTESENENE